MNLQTMVFTAGVLRKSTNDAYNISFFGKFVYIARKMDKVCIVNDANKIHILSIKLHEPYAYTQYTRTKSIDYAHIGKLINNYIF